jgi:hypothetical protein
MKRLCLAIAVLLQSAQGLPAAAAATPQQLITGAPTHLGLGGDPLVGLGGKLDASTAAPFLGLALRF